MGEVWKARDTRLNRFVAIKRLKGQIGSRFGLEARALAALNHPHVCQIYDVGPDYLVLEFIGGAPLRGPLSTAEAVALAIQIASALEAAHSRGILHRDLKPANIMVTEAGVKLLDFGLAKLTSDSESDVTRTLPGVAIGTVAYMAPEQAQGGIVDARSDIFSFGAVLYEALSGRRAFGRNSVGETLNAVVSGEPAPLDSPASAIVKRCLAKHPSQRFQNVAELKEALQAALARISEPAIPGQAVSPGNASIAVLPFANMSSDSEQEYFSDGLSEELINALARIPGLRVIARTSAFAFKGQNTDIRRIGEVLGVAHILEGSIRRSANQIRVTAQLITAADGSHLWSERFDRELADIFDMQDEIAAAIVGALQPKLTPQSAPRRRYAPKLEAHEALLRAWYCVWKLTFESVAQANRFFKQAIAADPQFALARSSFAEHLFFLAHAGAATGSDALPAMRAEARNALELDPSLPEAHAALALVAATYDYDWKEAGWRCTHVMTDAAVSPWTRALCAYHYLLPAGRIEESVNQCKLALETDPLHLLIRTFLALCLDTATRVAEAEEEIRQIIELDPSFGPAYFAYANLYTSRGRVAEALVAAEKAHSLSAPTVHSMGALAGLLARTGDLSRAEGLLDRIRKSSSYSTNIGMLYFCLYAGDSDGAADRAERAIQDRWPSIASVLSGGLAMNLRASSYWPKLAKMMRLDETA